MSQHTETGGDEPVYLYHRDADIKRDSLLENLKEDKRVFPEGIDHINKKLELHRIDSVTDREEEAWRLAFEMSLTDDYTLTKEQLLTSHDWWIHRLLYESGLDAEELRERIADIRDTQHKDIYQFLDHVLERFSLEELYTIGHTDMTEN
jgi:hypothetical protein